MILAGRGSNSGGVKSPGLIELKLVLQGKACECLLLLGLAVQGCFQWKESLSVRRGILESSGSYCSGPAAAL